MQRFDYEISRRIGQTLSHLAEVVTFSRTCQ